MSLHDLAKQVQSKGRDEDKILVHMTPEELGGLQHLAMAHGGSLTINPETGLVEAGFLKKLLPMIAGAVLTPLTGGLINPMNAGLIIGAAGTGIGLAKGKSLGASLMSGVKAGMSGYSGAGIGSSLASMGSKTLANKAAEEAVKKTAGTAGRKALGSGVTEALSTTPSEILGRYSGEAGRQGLSNIGSGIKALGQKGGLSTFGKGVMGSVGMTGVSGVLSGLTHALTPSQKAAGMTPEFMADNMQYTPPNPTMRKPVFNAREFDPMTGEGSQESNYFPDDALALSERLARLNAPQRAAKGGEIGMKNGDFVLDARTVSEIGNGSSGAGKEILARMGGLPVDGPGDGVSDSVNANIGGVQKARVARDEVIIPRKLVEAMGGEAGEAGRRRGAEKLYALMRKAAAARKSATRGKDTGLARSLKA
jgi:hypothetical protein